KGTTCRSGFAAGISNRFLAKLRSTPGYVKSPPEGFRPLRRRRRTRPRRVALRRSARRRGRFRVCNRPPVRSAAGMSPDPNSVTEVAAQLYALPPEQFVAARNGAAKQATGPAARHIKALRRPTVSAWLVNLLAFHRADDLAA